MQVTVNQHNIVVNLEAGEKVRHESDLMVQIVRTLKAQKLDVFKTTADHEGLMISNEWVIVDRKRSFVIYDEAFATRDAAKDLNFKRTINLKVYHA